MFGIKHQHLCVSTVCCFSRGAFIKPLADSGCCLTHCSTLKTCLRSSYWIQIHPSTPTPSFQRTAMEANEPNAVILLAVAHTLQCVQCMFPRCPNQPATYLLLIWRKSPPCAPVMWMDKPLLTHVRLPASSTKPTFDLLNLGVSLVMFIRSCSTRYTHVIRYIANHAALALSFL